MRVYWVIFWPHLGVRMGTIGVKKTNNTIMGGVQCLNALLLAPKSDCVEMNRREKRVKQWNNACKKNIHFSKWAAHIFSSIKKYKKSTTIGFESVPLNIKISVLVFKKEHTFSGFPHISLNESINGRSFLQPETNYDLPKTVAIRFNIVKHRPENSAI